MYNCTYAGVQGYIKDVSIIDLINFSTKKEFRVFEWESVTKSLGLSTKIRMCKIENKQVIPTTKWIMG